MKKFLGLLIILMMISVNCLAMTFSQPVKLGGIGFPTQSPYRYYLVDGASYNSGKPYAETPQFARKRTTYKEGIAVFDNDESKLYCKYIYAVPSSESDTWKYAIKFGGKDNYIISTESQYKDIYKIDTDEDLTLYCIFRRSGSEHINIIGRQNDGKWVSYIDSKTLSDKFFGGKDAYKASDGVHYDEPQFKNDTIIISYKYLLQNGRNVTTGEFRFKWDENAQWFVIEQVFY